MRLFSTILFTLVLASGSVFAQDGKGHSAHEHADVSRIGDPWPLETCIVSGEKLGEMGEPIIKLYEGREFRFCCKGCVGKFEKNPENYVAMADAAITEQQKDRYPLDYCISDTAESISADPDEDTFAVIGNRLFIFCCPPCEETVRAEPGKYIHKLDRAVVEKQTESYPLQICVISGQPLDSMGGPINMVVANQLVQLCCAGCKGNVEADPAGTLAKIHEARGGHDGHEGSATKPQAPEHGSETDHGHHGHH